MEEEFEVQESVSVQTSTITSVNEETKAALDSLPRIEELRRSEQAVKINTEVKGATQIGTKTQVKDKIFTRKVDEKKIHLKKRLKIVTAVYTTVVALLLGFAITNVITLAQLNKDINSNTETIQSQKEEIVRVLEETNPGENLGDYQISLNEPRDYSEDKKDLTWLDKITILFRNIFS